MKIWQLAACFASGADFVRTVESCILSSAKPVNCACLEVDHALDLASAAPNASLCDARNVVVRRGLGLLDNTGTRVFAFEDIEKQ